MRTQGLLRSRIYDYRNKHSRNSQGYKKKARVKMQVNQEKDFEFGQITSSFTPLTITVETLQALAKQERYADLLALYMAYVEISTWQETQSIKATADFMMKRLSWGQNRFYKAKLALVKLGLIIDRQNKEQKSGKMMGHYILVRHIVNHPTSFPEYGFDHSMDLETTSTTNLQESTTNQNKSASARSSKMIKTKHGEITIDEFLVRLISLVNKKEKPTEERLRQLRARLKDYTPAEVWYAAVAFSKSDWHKENNQMSIDNLLRPSKFGRWYIAKETSGKQSTASDGSNGFDDGYTAEERKEEKEKGKKWDTERKARNKEFWGED